ncbi:hypothetical protein RB3646 [Rhodopirellula baltica SH 1]|uniref:Uncharacterized protein n=1 Tax=Rhodopirellula baltica (strain DSM 10527 / NCIMB 13988 / SH1) TaxID=243090 RepID=Q7UTW8_RHOBA|nr:hypothetical protein RB3646 [Rhodopirellula baltica SH 1]
MDSANIESAKQAFLLTDPIRIRKTLAWLAEHVRFGTPDWFPTSEGCPEGIG